VHRYLLQISYVEKKIFGDESLLTPSKVLLLLRSSVSAESASRTYRPSSRMTRATTFVIDGHPFGRR
jgi:hypothetical protein